MNGNGRVTALARGLPPVARFYAAVSVVLAVLLAATALRTLSGGPAGQLIDLNPRTPVFATLSPWGRVVGVNRLGMLEATFDVLGVLTPIPEDAMSFAASAAAGEELSAVAARLGVDLDLLAGANSSSYAKLAGRSAEFRLPLLYSRERTWDRSLEFLYPTSLKVPLGSNRATRGGAPTIAEHTVRPGECLWNIAQKYRVKMETILAMNDLPNARYLRVGQVLQVPDTDGSFVTVRRGDTMEGICKRYGVQVTELVNANPGVDVARLMVNQRIFVPGLGAIEQLFRLVWPVHGRISGRYGHRFHPIFHRRMMHTGLDIAARHGTPIAAAMDGRVTFAGTKGGYGRTIIVEHPNGYETLYGHCSKILVKRGERVRKGQTIGRVGNTGYSTGPHLHFEVKRNGKRVNPESVLF
ncbi:MAG: peptidoglycan DD-metalloendopeptidase family protein [Candidatus Eisenbacteria bacterium]|nr:peptidoglycan DD-metalloendopeptidase family protein [Candidatus Eisenbacteria bacterium]